MLLPGLVLGGLVLFLVLVMLIAAIISERDGIRSEMGYLTGAMPLSGGQYQSGLSGPLGQSMGANGGGHWQASAQASHNSPYGTNSATPQRAFANTYVPIPTNLAGAGYLPATVAPPPAIENAGIRAGEIIAYRCWIVRVEFDLATMEPTGALVSVFKDTLWIPGVPMNGKPRPTCEGVYAFKTPEGLSCEYGALAALANGAGVTSIVFGTVSMWGEVIEHERGFRAEYAKIRSLDFIGSGMPEGLLANLRKKYGVN